jgi:hypothetical protein
MMAKIYEFPARGGLAAGARPEKSPPVANVSPRALKIVSSSAWYHEEAVDAERGDKK